MLKKTIKTLANGLGYDIKKVGFIETFFQIDPMFNALYEEAQRKRRWRPPIMNLEGKGTLS
jgi:hypothetical protein